jgi:putative transposase
MFKTVIFKLHNPSKRKQTLLQKAFRNYHLLYDRLLKVVFNDLDSFYSAIAYITKRGEARYSDKKAVQYINSQYRNILNAFVLASGLKESLCKDLAGNLLSYKELLTQRPNTSYPSLQKLKEYEKEKILGILYGSFKTCIDTETENYLRDGIARHGKGDIKIKPLSFIRCDISHQNMAFLYNPKKKKYYALLHILPSFNRQKLTITEGHSLHDVRTGGLFLKLKGTVTGLLFPIETGQRMVERYLNGKAEPKEGKLVYDSENDEYYLHLAFEFKPKKIETETIMGIDRGIEAICAYSVLDKKYDLLESSLYEGKTLKELLKSEEKRMSELQSHGIIYRLRVRRNWANRIIHEATNIVADIALKYKSQVYVEDLKPITDRSKARKRSSFNKILNRSQFQKFLTILEYKLEERGLPKAKKVHPAYTSMTCVECGLIERENRPKFDDNGNPMQDIFKCIGCGHEDNADKNASRAIALKGIWTYIKKEDKIKRNIDTFQKFLMEKV